MNLHEWLKSNKLDNKDILKIEQAYFSNKVYTLPDNHITLLYEWLCDPETIRDQGGF